MTIYFVAVCVCLLLVMYLIPVLDRFADTKAKSLKKNGQQANFVCWLYLLAIPVMLAITFGVEAFSKVAPRFLGAGAWLVVGMIALCAVTIIDRIANNWTGERR